MVLLVDRSIYTTYYSILCIYTCICMRIHTYMRIWYSIFISTYPRIMRRSWWRVEVFVGVCLLLTLLLEWRSKSLPFLSKLLLPSSILIHDDMMNVSLISKLIHRSRVVVHVLVLEKDSFALSLTDWLTDWLAGWLTEWRRSKRSNRSRLRRWYMHPWNQNTSQGVLAYIISCKMHSLFLHSSVFSSVSMWPLGFRDWIGPRERGHDSFASESLSRWNHVLMFASLKFAAHLTDGIGSSTRFRHLSFGPRRTGARGWAVPSSIYIFF